MQSISSMPSDPVSLALGWLQFAGVVLLGVVAYFLKRSLIAQDALEQKVQTLETKIAVLLDRDRRRRLEDYLAERGVEAEGEDSQ